MLAVFLLLLQIHLLTHTHKQRHIKEVGIQIQEDAMAAFPEKLRKSFLHI